MPSSIICTRVIGWWLHALALLGCEAAPSRMAAQAWAFFQQQQAFGVDVGDLQAARGFSPAGVTSHSSSLTVFAYQQIAGVVGQGDEGRSRVGLVAGG